ncbi:Lrp/AsnC family transcriptional regulator [Actinospica sp.]|uniref:Lrp/AsnC family transcriptional regulator n=1 Tax=Actinospica sp. TaxID=1872142 RepID=UPI002BFE3BCE|nr:AsnC family transcriptional regulator [Actinospica sp.]HWG25285.1 AsnC family transcriptional regulator [Actinospica sp.]
MKSSRFDALDRRILQALQLDGRLPFSRMAEVLGVSDQTIARRYTRLRTAGHLRVLASIDPSLMGEVLWLVRVQCRPDGAEKLGRTLAMRDDTAWVSMSSGGTEISCSTWAPAGFMEEPSLLLARLPNTPSVVSMSAHCVMHRFFGGSLGLTMKSGALSPEEVSTLQPEPVQGHRNVPGEQEPISLDDGDRRMLAVLGRDGRADLAELAAATGWSQSTVRRRLAHLRASGAVFLDVEYDYGIYDLATRVLLWASVPPAQLESAGLALADHPEVAYACATTGATNLHAVLLCKDLHSLYTYLTTRVADLGVRQVETSPIMRTLKGPATVRAPR